MSKDEMLNSLPLSIEGQKAVKSAIKELVDSAIRVDSEKELQKTIKETCSEKYQVSPKFVATQAALMYDLMYKEGKKKAAILEASEALDTYEGIFGDNA